MLKKPFEGLSGHGSSLRRRAKPEIEQTLTRQGKACVFLKQPAFALIIYF